MNFILKRMLLAAIVLPLVFVGCKKDDDDDKPAPSDNESDKAFAFKKDGVSQDYSDNASLNFMAPTIQVTGMEKMSTPSNRISIDIVDSVKIGTYKFGESMAAANYVEENDTSTTFYHAIDGELVIKNFNKDKKTISGTFHFTGKSKSSETVSISNGHFNIE